MTHQLQPAPNPQYMGSFAAAGSNWTALPATAPYDLAAVPVQSYSGYLSSGHAGSAPPLPYPHHQPMPQAAAAFAPLGHASLTAYENPTQATARSLLEQQLQILAPICRPGVEGSKALPFNSSAPLQTTSVTNVARGFSQHYGQSSSSLSMPGSYNGTAPTFWVENQPYQAAALYAARLSDPGAVSPLWPGHGSTTNAGQNQHQHQQHKCHGLPPAAMQGAQYIGMNPVGGQTYQDHHHQPQQQLSPPMPTSLQPLGPHSSSSLQLGNRGAQLQHQAGCPGPSTQQQVQQEAFLVPSSSQQQQIPADLTLQQGRPSYNVHVYQQQEQAQVEHAQGPYANTTAAVAAVTRGGAVVTVVKQEPEEVPSSMWRHAASGGMEVDAGWEVEGASAGGGRVEERGSGQESCDSRGRDWPRKDFWDMDVSTGKPSGMCLRLGVGPIIGEGVSSVVFEGLVHEWNAHVSQAEAEAATAGITATCAWHPINMQYLQQDYSSSIKPGTSVAIKWLVDARLRQKLESPPSQGRPSAAAATAAQQKNLLSMAYEEAIRQRNGRSGHVAKLFAFAIADDPDGSGEKYCFLISELADQGKRERESYARRGVRCPPA